MTTGEDPVDPAPESWALEIIGTLPRRDAEALILEIKELARRHGFKIAGVKTRPLAPEEPA